MHHMVKKQQSLFVLLALVTIFSVSGSQKSDLSLPTRRKLNGDSFARDMQRTVHAAQEQKNDDKDHPVRQDPAYLARVASKHRFASPIIIDPVLSEQAIVREYRQPAKENKNRNPLKNKSKAFQLNAKYAQLNQTFAEVDAFELEEEIDEKKYMPQKVSRSEMNALFVSLESRRTITPVAEQQESLMEVEEPVVNLFVNPVEQDDSRHTKKQQRPRILSEMRPAATRNNPDSQVRMDKRHAEVDQHSQYAGGTWDYLSQKALIHNPKK